MRDELDLVLPTSRELETVSGRCREAQAPPDACAARVLVVDDDEAMRVSLSRLLGSYGIWVVTFASAEQVLNAGDLESADCAIVDLRMPGANGLELQDRLASRAPDLHMVFLTACGDIRSSVRAVRDGAVDFLEKPVDPDVLLRAVGRARDLTRRSRRERSELGKLQARFDSMSVRERQVLEEILVGKGNKQIAATLGIVERTVKIHRSRIMRKSGFNSVAQLIRACCRLRREI